MRKSQKHIIRKQTIAIEMASPNGSVAVQDVVKNIYYNKILPRLDMLFSGLVTDETVIRIGRLDIDVGSISKDGMEDELAVRAIAIIQKQLEQKLKFDVNSANDVEAVSVHQSAIDELMYFLQHGYFSWRNQAKNIRLTEDAVMAEDIPARIFRERLIRAFKKTPAAVDRLVFQCADKFLHFLISNVSPGFDSEVFLASVKTNFISDDPGKNAVLIRNHFWKTVFTNIQLSHNNLEQECLFSSLKFAAAVQKTGIIKLLKTINAANFPEKVFATLKQVITQKIKRKDSERQAVASEENKLPDTDTFIEHIEAENTDASKKNIQASYPANNDVSINNSTLTNETINDILADTEEDYLYNLEEAAEPIYVQLAGIVLLHNFLNPFFEALGLIKDKKFTNETALHKAVLLTGYLATETVMGEESDLVLPKLLCGMQLSDAVDNSVEISEEEQLEAETLLKQVIAYWPAVKNTSPEGLRNSFLKREGKLARAGLGWQLDIENKTWDILLSKLPWGYSLIRLPWMKEFLFVNWA
ncbi:contractile injection system tape measure protein [Parafilimonas sp.]|uniref:contractile injection system tape measure protein n=1 Tax=Parafilimonas sp. TaxID=1969739 RepID=UPI0039E5F615